MAYHINSKGEPGVCKAAAGNCPFGSADEHYGSAAEARTAYETTMQAFPVSANKQSLKRLAASEAITSLVPRAGQYEAYYASTDAKHFTDRTGPGSKFTDPRLSKLEDVAALAHQQRGGLAGDDRELLTRMGADPEAFGPNFRYLLVTTPGELGSAPLTSFPPGTQFKAERTKVGGKVSITAEVEGKPAVQHAVVVMGTPPGVAHEVVITAHPGFPSRSSGGDTFASVEGRTLTAAEVAEVAGTTFVSVNTRLSS